MVAIDKIRRFAMALPEVDEGTHFGRPGFRVRDKLFASVHLNGEHPSVIVNVALADVGAEIPQDPAVVEEVWRMHGKNHIFVGLRINLAAASEQRCRELLELAWRNKAPKRLVAEFDKE